MRMKGLPLGALAFHGSCCGSPFPRSLIGVSGQFDWDSKSPFYIEGRYGLFLFAFAFVFGCDAFWAEVWPLVAITHLLAVVHQLFSLKGP